MHNTDIKWADSRGPVEVNGSAISDIWAPGHYNLMIIKSERGLVPTLIFMKIACCFE